MVDNIIFDGNYIFHSCVNALKNTNHFYTGLYPLLERTVEKFVQMNTWENVIFVSDTKKPSWRKQLRGDYKGTRKKDETVDWTFAYETYDEFKKDIKEKYHIFQGDHVEGDDWIFFLIKYFNKKKKGVCTITTDKDMYQLIRANIKYEYMNVQLEATVNKARFFIPSNWEILYDKLRNKDGTLELFNLNRNLDHINFFNYCRNNYNTIVKNNNEVFFKKILTGDAGDNVPSVHRRLTKSGKLYGIGKATANKVWDTYSNLYDTFETTDDRDLQNMIECYESVKKTRFSNELIAEIKSNIKSNIQMMELSFSIYPEKIKEYIVNKILNNFEQ